MKRFLRVLTSTASAAILVISNVVFPIVAHATLVMYSRGDGSAESPYNIANCAQLQNIQSDLEAHYRLVVNIDCDGYDFGHIGNDDTPFVGTLEGDNHIVRNLYIDDYGLFGTIANGVVHDLMLISPHITGSTYVGALAGKVIGSDSNISNVHVEDGSIGGSSNYIGGLIGGVATSSLGGFNNPVVEKSSYKGVVYSPGVVGGFIGTASGAAYIHNNYAQTTITVLPDDSPMVGGFFGLNSSSQTAENYAVATVDAQNGGFNGTVGGFVGLASGGQTSSFSDLNYNSGASQVGDFMGYSAGSTIGSDYYADHGHGFSSNSANPGGGAVAIDTTANPNYFKRAINAPLSGWDFENTWEQLEEDYPRLRNEANFSEVSNDLNGDEINDTYQATVIGVPDDNENVTVVELNPDTNCTLDPEGSWIDASYYKADPNFGLQIPRMTGFTVYCPTIGAQVIVTLVYPEHYNTDKSVLRFYNNITNEYHTISGVTFGTRVVNGQTVTTAQYMLVDGSENDTDGVADGVIHDPVAIALNNTPASNPSVSNGLATTGESTFKIVAAALTAVLLGGTVVIRLTLSRSNKR